MVRGHAVEKYDIVGASPHVRIIFLPPTAKSVDFLSESRSVRRILKKETWFSQENECSGACGRCSFGQPRFLLVSPDKNPKDWEFGGWGGCAFRSSLKVRSAVRDMEYEYILEKRRAPSGLLLIHGFR